MRAMTTRKPKRGGPRPGAGRPKTRPETRHIVMRLDAALVREADTEAQRRGITRTRAMEDALRLWLDNL